MNELVLKGYVTCCQGGFSAKGRVSIQLTDKKQERPGFMSDIGNFVSLRLKEDYMKDLPFERNDDVIVIIKKRK